MQVYAFVFRYVYIYIYIYTYTAIYLIYIYIYIYIHIYIYIGTNLLYPEADRVIVYSKIAMNQISNMFGCHPTFEVLTHRTTISAVG